VITAIEPVDGISEFRFYFRWLLPFLREVLSFSFLGGRALTEMGCVRARVTLRVVPASGRSVAIGLTGISGSGESIIVTMSPIGTAFLSSFLTQREAAEREYHEALRFQRKACPKGR
jgi:hypothetical protein